MKLILALAIGLLLGWAGSMSAEMYNCVGGTCRPYVNPYTGLTPQEDFLLKQQQLLQNQFRNSLQQQQNQNAWKFGNPC